MSAAEVDAVARSVLANSAAGISVETLLGTLCQYFHVADFCWAVADLPTVHAHVAVQSRAVARVVAAVLTRPIVTLHELELEIAAAERVGSYRDLRLGQSLQELHVAQRYFGLAPGARRARPTTSAEVMRFFLRSAEGAHLLWQRSDCGGGAERDDGDGGGDHDGPPTATADAGELVDGFARSVGLHRGRQCGIHIQNLQSFRMLLRTESARFPGRLVELLCAFDDRFRVAPRPVHGASSPTAVALAARQQQQPSLSVATHTPTATTMASRVMRSSAGVLAAATASASAGAASSTARNEPIAVEIVAAARRPSAIKFSMFSAADVAEATTAEPHKAAEPVAVAAPASASPVDGAPRAVFDTEAWLASCFGKNSGDGDVCSMADTRFAAVSARLAAMVVPDAGDVGAQRRGAMIGWPQWNAIASRLAGVPGAASAATEDAADVFEAFLLWGAVSASATRKPPPDVAAAVVATKTRRYVAPTDGPAQHQPQQQPQHHHHPPLVETGPSHVVTAAGQQHTCVPVPHVASSFADVDGNGEDDGTRRRAPEEQVVFLYCFGEPQERAFSRAMNAASSHMTAERRWHFARAFAASAPVVVLSSVCCVTPSMAAALRGGGTSQHQHQHRRDGDPAAVSFLSSESCFTTDFVPGPFSASYSAMLTTSLAMALQALRCALKGQLPAPVFVLLDHAMRHRILPKMQLVAVESLVVRRRFVLPSALGLGGGGDGPGDVSSSDERAHWDGDSCTLFVAVDANVHSHAVLDGNAPRPRGHSVATQLAAGIVDSVCADFDFPEKPLETLRNLRWLREARHLMQEHFRWSLFLTPDVLGFECRARGLVVVLEDCSERAAVGQASTPPGRWTLAPWTSRVKGRFQSSFPIAADGSSVPVVPTAGNWASHIKGAFHRHDPQQHQGGGSAPAAPAQCVAVVPSVAAHLMEDEAEDGAEDDDGDDATSAGALTGDANVDNLTRSLRNPHLSHALSTAGRRKTGAGQLATIPDQIAGKRRQRQDADSGAFADADAARSQNSKVTATLAERVVFERLRRLVGTAVPWGGKLVGVRWVNETAEGGLPYDIVETHAPPDGRGTYEIFTEVKSSGKRRGDFYVSVREFACAVQLGQRFQIVQALGVNNADGCDYAKVSRIVDPVALWQRGQIRVEGDIAMCTNEQTPMFKM